MVFTAQLATAGGVRAPLASLANRVFLDLTNELRNQGLTHSVIADMFGITLRSYHRRVRELDQSQTVAGSTVWEAVLGFLREHEPVSSRAGYRVSSTPRAPSREMGSEKKRWSTFWPAATDTNGESRASHTTCPAARGQKRATITG